MNIYFDLDGPILDVSERYFRVHRAITCQATPGRLDKARYWEMKRQRRSLNEILEADGLRLDVGAYWRAWLKHIELRKFMIYDQLVFGATKVLSQLAADHRLVLVTLRQRPDNLRWELEHLDIARYFHRVLSGHAEQISGWDMKATLIRNDLNSSSGMAVIMGDTEVDIRAGQLLGIFTVAICNGIRSSDWLISLGPDSLIGAIIDVPTILQRLK